jgi:hypothetical protein
LFYYKNYHKSVHKIVEFEPARKIVWQITGSQLNFIKDKEEWNNTTIVFEITEKNGKTELLFSHVGLVPAAECYKDCSGAWDFYIKDSLHKLITTGRGKPNKKEN